MCVNYIRYIIFYGDFYFILFSQIINVANPLIIRVSRCKLKHKSVSIDNKFIMTLYLFLNYFVIICKTYEYSMYHIDIREATSNIIVNCKNKNILCKNNFVLLILVKKKF